MKKIIFVLPVVALLAASCGKSANNPPAAQNSGNQNQSSQQNSQPAPTAAPANTGSPASAGAAAVQYKTIDVPSPTAAYASAADGFTVNFPGTPKITKSTFPSPTAGAIPLTQYREIYSSGSEYAFYTIYVYHYPSTYKFASDYLSAALQIFTKDLNDMFPGTVIASQQQSQFLGNQALAGILTVPVKLNPGSAATTDTGDYFLATVKGQNIYVISAYGMDQSNYNAFISSFKFTR